MSFCLYFVQKNKIREIAVIVCAIVIFLKGTEIGFMLSEGTSALSIAPTRNTIDQPMQLVFVCIGVFAFIEFIRAFF